MREQRKHLKHLVLTAINAKSKLSAFRAFRENYAPGDRGKRMKDRELKLLLDAFLTKHPHLADCMFADQGIRLMNVDARIAERVLRVFAHHATPILSIHDSFIVDYCHAGALKAAMRAASRTVVGEELALSHNYVGLDEMAGDEHRQDYIEFRKLDRSRRYLERSKFYGYRVQEE